MKKIKLYKINEASLASRILDFIRFLSALIVFLFHFYVPLPGYQAVMIFFVLSGYFISLSVLNIIKNKKWKWSDYLIKRLLRLWIVLIPCLLLTIIWANMQLSLLGYDQHIVDVLNIKTFLGNLFFLQGILVEPFGKNGPLWSLSYEFWYYILFPCLVLIVTSKKIIVKSWYVLLFVGIAMFVGEKIMLYFLVWLLGAVVPLIKPFYLNNKYLKNLLLIFSICLVLASVYQHLILQIKLQFLKDLGVGASFALLTYILVSLYNSEVRNSTFNISKYLAGFSFTLYLVHYPLANFILTWLVSPYWPFQETTLTIKILFALAVFIYAWLIALITEKHTDKVRKRIFTYIKREGVWINKKGILNSHNN